MKHRAESAQSIEGPRERKWSNMKKMIVMMGLLALSSLLMMPVQSAVMFDFPGGCGDPPENEQECEELAEDIEAATENEFQKWQTWQAAYTTWLTQVGITQAAFNAYNDAVNMYGYMSPEAEAAYQAFLVQKAYQDTYEAANLAAQQAWSDAVDWRQCLSTLYQANCLGSPDPGAMVGQPIPDPMFAEEAEAKPAASVVALDRAVNTSTQYMATMAPASSTGDACTVQNDTTCDVLVWRSNMTPEFTSLPPGTTTGIGVWAGDSVDFVRLDCVWYKLSGGLGHTPHYRITEVPCGSHNFNVEEAVIYIDQYGVPFLWWQPVAPWDCANEWCPSQKASCPLCPDAPCDCGGGGGGDPEEPPIP